MNERWMGRSLSALLLAMSVTTCMAAQEAPVTSASLALKDAERILDGATEKARALNARVCIAVSDSGGALLTFRRMEGAASGCADSAIAKAHSSAIFRAPTALFMDMVNKGQPAVGYLPGMVPLGGGVPLLKGTSAYGAVGVAGASIDDEISIASDGAKHL
jgi:glc operon protein GlcG